jgi:hypothetical protein
MAMSTGVAEVHGRGKVGAILVALALALALAVLLAQANAIIRGRTASVPPVPAIHQDVLDQLVHPGAHRGQVRVMPEPRPEFTRVHGPSQRPKWGA